MHIAFPKINYVKRNFHFYAPLSYSIVVIYKAYCQEIVQNTKKIENVRCYAQYHSKNRFENWRNIRMNYVAIQDDHHRKFILFLFDFINKDF